ncbi:hypothetical protein PG995_003992 [Apiospora arundinis]|uniref:Uncharacterized protein n=1 Tax=Apiospora arundinis TaxID=335852 RepID=A0ABR2HQQ9_9PEZI
MTALVKCTNPWTGRRYPGRRHDDRRVPPIRQTDDSCLFHQVGHSSEDSKASPAQWHLPSGSRLQFLHLGIADGEISYQDLASQAELDKDHTGHIIYILATLCFFAERNPCFFSFSFALLDDEVRSTVLPVLTLEKRVVVEMKDSFPWQTSGTVIDNRSGSGNVVVLSSSSLSCPPHLKFEVDDMLNHGQKLLRADDMCNRVSFFGTLLLIDRYRAARVEDRPFCTTGSARRARPT